MNNTCNLCPRRCNTDRNTQKGRCRQTNNMKVARVAPHYWEEPVISGENGSGAVFFSGCTLGCVYCQNDNISQGSDGKTVSIERLTEMFFELKEKGCHNINLVTADHFMTSVKIAIKAAKDKGFDLPFILNTGGYLTKEFVEGLSGYIDIFLTDFKYITPEIAKRYSKAEDYPKYAMQSLEAMVNLTGDVKYDNEGMLKKGVIVRHLVMPGYVEESKKVLDYLYDTYEDKIIYSIMGQYTPISRNLKDYPEINRKITEEEYDEVTDYAWDIGIEDAYIQLPGSDDECYIPEFDNTGVN